MFDDKSRYKDCETYQVHDRRERIVTVVAVPEAPRQSLRGYHRLMQGQRLDHLSQHYLADPAGYWRICELNDVMLAEALAEADEIGIPVKGR
jgi:hypothetical protein